MATVALGTKEVGSIVKLNVDGTPWEFIVVHQGKPGDMYDDSCDGVWLLMKDCYEKRQWHSSNVNDYANSTIHAYHADGELCRMYPAEEFAALAQAATGHVFYHRTYCNHMNAWIKRAGLEELAGIAYGAALPEDLAAGMAAILSAAGGGGDAV